ncbi:lysophospholipase [Planctomicrobium sp. SH668]|uniref:alpha/beta hydrolase n=1 Tax=Planctomicrobium sp. SH668 TaxID=3448126 RepID=UPI003F5C7063
MHREELIPETTSPDTSPSLSGQQHAVEELFVNTPDSINLLTRVQRVDSPLGIVVMTHGLGEHSGRYHHVAESFLNRGIAVVRYDLRGHGRSEGRRGCVPRYDAFLDDLSAIVQFAKGLDEKAPLIIYGHSLGGNIAANWVLRRSGELDRVAGVVLSSPWFTLTQKQSDFKVWAIRTLSKYWPNLLVPASFRPKKLTRNQEQIDAYNADPLIHRLASVRLISDSYYAGLWALDHAREFPVPLLALHGTDDSVTNPEGTRQFTMKVPHGDLLIFEGLVHEPHNEPEWRSVVEQIGSWMVARINEYRAKFNVQ